MGNLAKSFARTIEVRGYQVLIMLAADDSSDSQNLQLIHRVWHDESDTFIDYVIQLPEEIPNEVYSIWVNGISEMLPVLTPETVDESLEKAGFWDTLNTLNQSQTEGFH